MPIKDKDVQDFYDELLAKGELSAEEKKSLDSLFEKDKVQNIFKGGVSATKRFHQEMDKLSKREKELETEVSRKIRDLDSLRTTLAATSSVEIKEVERLKSAISQRESQLKSIHDELLTYENG